MLVGKQIRSRVAAGVVAGFAVVLVAVVALFGFSVVVPEARADNCASVIAAWQAAHPGQPVPPGLCQTTPTQTTTTPPTTSTTTSSTVPNPTVSQGPDSGGEGQSAGSNAIPGPKPSGTLPPSPAPQPAPNGGSEGLPADQNGKTTIETPFPGGPTTVIEGHALPAMDWILDSEEGKASPTLRKQYDWLVSQGWTIEMSDGGKGTYTRREEKLIVIDTGVTKGGNFSSGVRALAHEMGHAYNNPGKSTDQRLTGEGFATLNELNIRNEVLRNLGRDIGFTGSEGPEGAGFEKLHEKWKAGKISENDAAKQIGAYYGDHYTPSTCPSIKYREYYATGCP